MTIQDSYRTRIEDGLVALRNAQEHAPNDPALARIKAAELMATIHGAVGTAQASATTHDQKMSIYATILQMAEVSLNMSIKRTGFVGLDDALIEIVRQENNSPPRIRGRASAKHMNARHRAALQVSAYEVSLKRSSILFGLRSNLAGSWRQSVVEHLLREGYGRIIPE